MKELFTYQEIGTLIDQGTSATFTRHIVARVTVTQPTPDSETVKALLLLSLRQYNIGVVEMEYTDISELLEAFGIDDGEEIWEVPS